jgi:hypothetical protein
MRRRDCDSIKNKVDYTLFMASPHHIVVALVGEAPLRTEGSTSRRLFLDRIAVASHQWENGLVLKEISFTFDLLPWLPATSFLNLWFHSAKYNFLLLALF